MSEESDLERSEAPTPRRLEHAREEGQLARSKELTTFAVLMAGGGGIWLMGTRLMDDFAVLLKRGLHWERATAFDPDLMLSALYEQALSSLSALAPLLLVLTGVAVAAPLLVNGWLFSFKPLQPDFSRLNPLQGLTRMFSISTLIELAKALAKAALVAIVAIVVMWQMQGTLLGLAAQSLQLALKHLGSLIAWSFFATAGALVLIAMADVPVALWEQGRKLRMSKEEVRRDARESEGDPHIKGRIRSAQREAARRRMMSEVPAADVVVTNPTHYAVAIKYRDQGMRAPQVIAKGAHLLAQRIRNVAEEHRVPVLEAPPLARALYHHTELGDEIPERLYVAVAQVLAYVYQLRRYNENGGQPPRPLDPVIVPPDLDPESAEAGDTP